MVSLPQYFCFCFYRLKFPVYDVLFPIFFICFVHCLCSHHFFQQYFLSHLFIFPLLSFIPRAVLDLFFTSSVEHVHSLSLHGYASSFCLSLRGEVILCLLCSSLSLASVYSGVVLLHFTLFVVLFVPYMLCVPTKQYGVRQTTTGK